MQESAHLYAEAIAYLRELIEQSRKRGEPEPQAASLATATTDGRPSVRIIDLAGVDESGLHFFANKESGKGQQMLSNPRAAICMFWASIQEQAIVEGAVEMLDEEESDNLWRKRPREAQLGAWVSEQGQPMSEAGDLKTKRKSYKQAFDTERVARPTSWCAFRLLPDRFAFWQSGWHRLRARVHYEHRPDSGWQVEYVQP